MLYLFHPPNKFDKLTIAPDNLIFGVKSVKVNIHVYARTTL